MTPQRWGLLALVLVALGLSLAYGVTRGQPSTTSADLGPLQRQARLEPCPTGLGPAFPDIALPCLGGGPKVSLTEPGPALPTLVNVYGSWCGPCQKEMPLLRDLYAKARGRLALVGVDTQEKDVKLGLRFAIDVQQRWPTLYDDDRSVGAHFTPGVPLMVFLDAAGSVKHVESGGYKDRASLEGDVRTYLGVAL